MVARLLACFSFLCAASFGVLDAATLHAIYVADVQDAQIGVSTKADVDHLSAQINTVKDLVGLKLNQVLLSGPQFKIDTVLNYIDALQVAPDDVVLFYYSGHGYRTDVKDSKWPALFFSWEEGLDLKTVTSHLQAKKARFVFVMADCCNNVLARDGAPSYRALRKDNMNARMVENYKALFLKTKGVLTLASAGVGEYAYCSDQGGYFTTAFLQSLNHGVLYADQARWDHIIDVAAWSLRDLQHPIYEYTPALR